MGRKTFAKNAVASADLRMYDGKSPKTSGPELRLKKKKVSKKNKLAWRKHTDVADIEAFIDEKRQEERTGGPASSKGDADIFFMHTESAAQAEADPRPQRTKKREKKPLRCYAAIQSEKGPEPKAKKGSSLSKPKRRAMHMEVGSTSKAAAVKVVDAWAKDESVPSEEQEIFDALTRRKPVKRPGRLYKKSSQLPSLEVAHPGASYNPSFEDHQAILRAATSIEEEKLRKAAKIDRFFEGMPEMTHIDRERTWLEEMSAGLDKDEDEGNSSEEDSSSESELRGGEAAPAPKLVRPEDRKTKQQRRREAERRQQAARTRDARVATLREQEVFRIRSLKKSINQQEKQVEERQHMREEKVAKEATAPRKLGPHQFNAPDMEVQLGEELAGSLRKLKPEGSTMMDRFSSLQKRNVIETRKKVVPHRRYKLRTYTKNAYKGGDD